MEGVGPRRGAPVVFLGVSERAQQVNSGHPHLHKWNILGLRKSIIFKIFPASMDTWSVGFAIDLAELKDRKSCIEFQTSSGEVIGKMGLELMEGSSEVGSVLSSNESVPISVDGIDSHYSVLFISLTALGWVVPEPGEVRLFYVGSEEKESLGSIHFYPGFVEPLTPARIDAIKSNPYANKSVRMMLGCKHCDGKMSVAAALDRGGVDSEDIWYEEVPQEFVCNCGKTKYSLEYLRKNLHVLLEADSTRDIRASIVPLYEVSRLRNIYKEFSGLLDGCLKEEEYQKYINSNSILLHQFPARKFLIKPRILSKYVADYGIVTPSKELIFIEIEKPTTRLMKKNGAVASDLSHAIDQVSDWLHVAAEHRVALLDDLGIDRSLVSRIRGVVIAGRDKGYDAADLRRLKARENHSITIMTYDDIRFALDILAHQVGESR